MAQELIVEDLAVTPIRVQGTARVNSHLVTKGMPPRTAVVTRARTKDGVVGESVTTVGYGVDAGLVAGVITNEIAPRVKGLSAFATERCWQAMWPVTASIMRDRRIGVRAQACVDSALWDAVGKALEVPLYRLWGGYTDTLPVVELGGFWEQHKTEADYVRDVEAMRERGAGGCKFKVGKTSNLGPEDDARRIRAVREALGPDFLLIADANQGWSLEDATRFAQRTQDLDLLWIEEPCHWNNDRRALADFRARTGARVAAGQMELTVEGCRDLIAERAVDVCNFDAAWGGGPTAWLRMARLAQAYGVQVSQHQEPQLGAHLSAAVANGTILEVYSPQQDPIWDAMFPNRPRYVDGKYTLGPEPGWGLQIDWDMVERYKA